MLLHGWCPDVLMSVRQELPDKRSSSTGAISSLLPSITSCMQSSHLIMVKVTVISPHTRDNPHGHEFSTLPVMGVQARYRNCK
jgi:hypothetical protein